MKINTTKTWEIERVTELRNYALLIIKNIHILFTFNMQI